MSFHACRMVQYFVQYLNTGPCGTQVWLLHWLINNTDTENLIQGH